MTLELVRTPIPAEPVAALEKILEDARAGIYTGFIIGLTRPRLRFSVHCVGDACTRTTWARGICDVLKDELRDIDRGEDRDTQF